jgi:RNA ligase
MIGYTFPTINNISDVLPHIEGCDEFRVIRKDWYTVVNYVVALEDTFPSTSVAGGSARMREERLLRATMRRECRGLIFDSVSGNVLSRPYHKFFNVNEKPETHANKVNLTARHVILEKLDGSMIRPIAIPGTNNTQFRLGTKAGVTDVAMNAEVWMAQRPNYAEFIRMMLAMNVTPVFEWCSRKNRIVVDYPEDRLVLTAARHNRFGFYMPHKALVQFAKDYSLDVVKTISSTSNGIDELIGTIRAWEGEEGVVIRWESPEGGRTQGHMVKIKSASYVTLHRSKEALSNEKNVINLIVNNQIDDVIPLLTESDVQRLFDFQKAFWLSVDEVVSEMVDVYLADGVSIIDQKDFALQFVSQQDKHWHSFMYGLRKGKNVKTMIIEAIKGSLTSGTRVDKIRWAFGNLRWNA